MNQTDNEIKHDPALNKTKRNSLGDRNHSLNKFEEEASQDRRKTLAPSSAKPPLLLHQRPDKKAGEAFTGSLDQYAIGKQIGQGAYASVKLVQNKANNQKYALKVYEKFRLTDPMKRKAVQREIAVLKKVDHPSVIQLVELIDTAKQINLVTEYVQGISMHQFCKNINPQRRVPEDQCRPIFRQIAEGMEYLHSQGVAHRDIKLDNLIIDEKTGAVKIIDFGFSVMCNPSQKLKIFCGTPSYMAPELTMKREYDGKAVDMWALGVLLFVMITGAFPFRGQSESELYAKI